MCGIAGIFSFNNQNVSSKIKRMLIAIKHRGPDGSGIIINDTPIYGELESLDLPNGVIGIGHNRLSIAGRGLQPIPNENRDLWLVHNGEICNYGEVKRVLKNHKFRTNMDSEAILHAYEEGRIKLLDGNYAFAIYNLNKQEIEIYRDVIGIRPLFYCFNGSLFAFASERKALRNVCDRHIRLLPGHKINVSHDGISVERFEDIDLDKKEMLNNPDIAEKELLEKLSIAVNKRLYSEIGILFSGGIDSSIIAKIAIDLGAKVKLITVGLEGSTDLLRARKIASLMGMELDEVLIKRNEVLDLFKRVIRIIDEPDPMKAMIGIPIYVATKHAYESGLRVIFTGQGADELFGGYMKYLHEKNLETRLMIDLLNIYKTNLERDDHCSMSNSVELRVPYLDKGVINIALKVPIQFKIRNGVRKWILRRVGERIGLPKESVIADKKAIQYGTRVAYILKKEARKLGKNLSTLAEEIYRENYDA